MPATAASAHAAPIMLSLPISMSDCHTRTIKEPESPSCVPAHWREPPTELAKLGRGGGAPHTERPSTHSTHSNTLDLRRKARAWCFLELCRNPTTTTPHAQGASGYTKLVRRRALYRALGDLPGNAGRWLLGRSPLRSRCEVVRGKHWRNSNLHSGPRFRRSKKLTPRAAERARPQQERAREALWLTRSSTVLTRHPRCCTSLWLMLPGRTWKGCTWRPVPMRHQSSSTGWTSTESAMI